MRKCQLIAIALTVVTLTAANVNTGFAQKGNKKDTTVIFEHSKITLRNTMQREVDTVIDPVMGTATLKTMDIYEPLYVNGAAVHKEQSPYETGKNLQSKIADQLRHSPILKSLPDGKVKVNLRNVVVSPKGELAYYELVNIKFVNNQERRSLSDDLLTKKMLADAILSLSLKPKAQYTLLHMDLSNSWFVIKKGLVTFTQGKR